MCGARNSPKHVWFLRDIWCCAAPEGTTVGQPGEPLDGASGILECPSGSVPCGTYSAPNEGYVNRDVCDFTEGTCEYPLDQLYCCPMSGKEPGVLSDAMQPSTKGGDVKCADGEIVCGLQHYRNANYVLDAIHCCPLVDAAEEEDEGEIEGIIVAQKTMVPSAPTSMENWQIMSYLIQHGINADDVEDIVLHVILSGDLSGSSPPVATNVAELNESVSYWIDDEFIGYFGNCYSETQKELSCESGGCCQCPEVKVSVLESALDDELKVQMKGTNDISGDPCQLSAAYQAEVMLVVTLVEGAEVGTGTGTGTGIGSGTGMGTGTGTGSGTGVPTGPDVSPSECAVLSTGIWDETNGCCDTDDAWCADDGWYCYDGHRSLFSDLSGGACACLSPGGGWDTTRMCCDAWDSWPTDCHPEEPEEDPGAVDAFFASGGGHAALLDMDKQAKSIIDNMRDTYTVEYIFDAGADISVINAFRDQAEDEYHTLVRDALRSRADERVKDILDTPLFQRPPDPTADIVALVNNGPTAEELDKLPRYTENRTYMAVVLARIDAASVPITMSVIEQLGDDSLGNEVRRRLITHTWSVFSRRLDHDARIFSQTCTLDDELRALDVQADVDLVAMEYTRVNDLLVLLDDDPDGSLCGNWFNRGGCGRWKTYAVEPYPVDILAWTCNEPECTCLSPEFSINDVYGMVKAFPQPRWYSFPEERGKHWIDSDSPSTQKINVESDGCFFLQLTQDLPHEDITPLGEVGDCRNVYTADGCSSIKEYEAPASELVAEVMPFDEKDTMLHDPPWWDESWAYRVPVTITNQLTYDITDVQVALSLDTSTLTESGKIRADCGDIRVIDSTNAAIPIWVGSDCGGTATKVWVKLGTLPASGSLTLHLYYGNDGASSVSDGPSVFALFDDFEDGNIDGWTPSQIGQSTQDGETYQASPIDINAGAGSYSLYLETHSSCSASPWNGIHALVSKDVTLTDGSYVVDLLRRAWGHRNRFCPTGNPSYIPRTFVRHGDTNIFATTALYAGNECVEVDTDWGDVTTDPFEVTGGTATIRLVTYSWDCENGKGWFDNVRVRRSVDPAPSVALDDEVPFDPEASNWVVSKAPFDETIEIPGQTGGFGKALDFDGTDDSVEISDNSALRVTPPITVEAWIKADNWEAEVYEGIIVDKHNWQGIGGYGGYVLRTGENGKLSFNFGACGGTWPSATSAGGMQIGQWYHVAGTHDGSTIRLYINGEDAGSTSTSKAICGTTDPLTIGRGSFWNDRLFDGQIDDVRIWKTALSKATLQEWMSKTVDEAHPDYNNLVVYYQFDEVSGTTANDGKSNLGGTLKGGVNRVPSTIPVDETTQFVGPDLTELLPGFKWALGLDGVDDHVKIPHNSDFNVPDISVEAWVNLPDGPIPNNGKVVAKSDGINANSDRSFVIRIISDRRVHVAVFQSTGGYKAKTTSTKLKANTWHHLAFTAVGGKLTIYIDGEVEEKLTYDGSIRESSEPVYIGRSGYSSGKHYKGQVDEVRIWGTGLSQETLKAWQYRVVDATHPNKDDLIAYYQFDEGTFAMIRDNSGNGHDGTLKNVENTDRPTSDVPYDMDGDGEPDPVPLGGFGTALAFDGVDEYVAVPSKANVNFAGSDDITLEAWIFNEGGGIDSHIIGKRFNGRCGLSIAFTVDPNRKLGFGMDSFSCWPYCAGARQGYCWSWIKSLSEVPDLRWTHVAMTKSGKTIRLFINGALDGEGEIYQEAFNAESAPTELRIGRSRGEHPQDFVNYFLGKIDEVRIWDTALSGGTIHEWMYKTVNEDHPQYANLVAYYPFDESEGTTATDMAGGDNDASLINMEVGPELVEVASDVCGDGLRGTAFRDRNLDQVNDEVCEPPARDGCWCLESDCCCCYATHHDHDLGAVFTPDQLVVQFASNFQSPGKRAEVSVSETGSSWIAIGETKLGYKYNPSNTTFNVKGQAFRYVRVKATEGYNDDWSGVWVYEFARFGPYDLALSREATTLDTPSISCGNLPCRYTFHPGAGNLQVAIDQELNVTIRKLGSYKQFVEPAAQDIVASAEEDQITIIENLIATLTDAPDELGIGQELQDIAQEAGDVLNQSIEVSFANDALYSIGVDLNITGLTNETLEALVNGTWLALQLDVEGSQELISDAASLSDHADRTIRTRENLRIIAEQALVKAILEKATASNEDRLALVLGARKLVEDVYANVLDYDATTELLAKLDLAIEELIKPEPNEAVVEDTLRFVRENLPEVKHVDMTDIPVLGLGRGELAASARAAMGLSSGMSTMVERMQGLVGDTSVNASVDTYLVNGKQVSVFTMSIENEGDKELKDVGMPLKIAKCHLTWFNDANFDEKPSMVRPDPLVLWNLGNLRPKQKTELKFSTTRVFCSDGSTCTGGTFCADICLTLGQCATSCQVCGQACDSDPEKDEMCSSEGQCVQRGAKLRNERCGCDAECETDNCVRQVCCEKNEFADASGQCTDVVNMMNMEVEALSMVLNDERVVPIHLINPLSRLADVEISIVDGGAFAELSKRKVALGPGEKQLIGLRVQALQAGDHSVVLDLSSTEGIRESLSISVQVLTDAEAMGIEMRTAPGPGLPLLVLLATVCALWTSTGRRRESD